MIWQSDSVDLWSSFLSSSAFQSVKNFQIIENGSVCCISSEYIVASVHTHTPTPHHAPSFPWSHLPALIPEKAETWGPQNGPTAVLPLPDPLQRDILTTKEMHLSSFWKTVHPMASEYYERIENRGQLSCCRVGLPWISQLTYLLPFWSSLQELKKYI